MENKYTLEEATAVIKGLETRIESLLSEHEAELSEAKVNRSKADPYDLADCKKRHASEVEAITNQLKARDAFIGEVEKATEMSDESKGMDAISKALTMYKHG